jgi:hypothetical protein
VYSEMTYEWERRSTSDLQNTLDNTVKLLKAASVGNAEAQEEALRFEFFLLKISERF